MECTDRIRIHELILPSRRIIIADPLFGRNKRGIYEITEVFEGKWNGCYSYKRCTNGNYRHHLTIKSEEYGNLNDFYQSSQKITQRVYSGYLGIFDSQHYHMNSYFSNSWYEYCIRQLTDRNNCVQITCGIVFRVDKEDCRMICHDYKKEGVLHRLDVTT